ncbi:hypothetical protein NQ315_006795 [Exocentrus adspersus]|uniref:DNA repair and recombination protein RAD54-like n=1 Tax=Exocentrus adspersus TaxID=1586481 RepID=A0AAV8WCI7_9CUCU|nr:hypothetical protein NQ315_006795 [Exocentrus adspersus]
MVDKLLPQNKDLLELNLSEGVSVWGTNQEVLENQALKELETFAEHSKQEDDLEEGEIVEIEVETDTGTNRKSVETNLNIEAYIRRQQDLKKRQEYKKSLGVSDYSKELAQKLSRKRSGVHSKRTSKKRKLESNTNSRNRDETSVNNEHCDAEEKNELVEEELVSKNIETEEKSGSEYVPSDSDFDSDCDNFFDNSEGSFDNVKASNKKKRITVGKRKGKCENIEKIVDDGLLHNYQSRLNLYYKQLEEELSLNALNDAVEESTNTEFHMLKGGLKVPLKIWQKLYSYQQDGVKWLWSIHQKTTGGLLGDEMGLGKTVQIIAFFSSLEYSKTLSCHARFKGLGPTIIVCPATVINQWVKHFHEWAPEFRVAVLHQSGSFQGNKATLIKEMNRCKGIIVTTYLGILKYKGNLLEYNWHYFVLDEGHKIRNPTAKVSIAVKEIRTPHRLLLTGSPMQNNLTELWSLFDFTNPSMLGNLTTFQEHFATPILHGGFANSTSMQEATALSVATTLKNIITPFLLRRSKSEVQQDILLPHKTEQVLFCSLTKEQRDLYKGYLMSEDVNTILGRGVKNWHSENHMRANVLVAITTLRKICNHPDIYLSEADENKNWASIDDEVTPIEERFGFYKRSGKMVVVSALLKIWKRQGHRVLLFTQGRSMISIFQYFLEQQDYKYLKMDGNTSISSRQALIDKFNLDLSYNVFLLTTRVGGLGINLTGANRVIIFDPDWNPATDTQARERAWRIGQEKEVTIYRLLSAGTIEEKMYQRQIWKQLLSNKVLIDPRTNKFFKTSDLHDLFSLQESTDTNPETANIFRNSRIRIEQKIKRKKKDKKSKKNSVDSALPDVQFSEDKIQAMKNLAQQIAKSLSQNEEPVPAPKPAFQLELELERQEKLKEKQELKKLSAQELLIYNKEKANRKDDDSINKVDGCETNVSFSSALEYSEKTAKLHHILVSGKVKDSSVVAKKVAQIRKDVIKPNKDKEPWSSGTGFNNSDMETESCSGKHKESKKHKKKKRYKEKSVVDTSGSVEGEMVEGLVRSEVRKIKSKKDKSEGKDSQDEFILGKLFSKKGVSGALHHDSIIQSGFQSDNLKIHTDARVRAEKSLEALRKSRIDNWRW